MAGKASLDSSLSTPASLTSTMASSHWTEAYVDSCVNYHFVPMLLFPSSQAVEKEWSSHGMEDWLPGSTLGLVHILLKDPVFFYR